MSEIHPYFLLTPLRRRLLEALPFAVLRLSLPERRQCALMEKEGWVKTEHVPGSGLVYRRTEAGQASLDAATSQETL